MLVKDTMKTIEVLTQLTRIRVDRDIEKREQINSIRKYNEVHKRDSLKALHTEMRT